MVKRIGCGLLIIATGIILWSMREMLVYIFWPVLIVLAAPFQEKVERPVHFDQVQATMLSVREDPRSDYYGDVVLQYEYDGQIRQVEVRSAGFPFEGKVVPLGVCRYDSSIIKSDEVNNSDYRCERMGDALRETGS